MKTNLTTSEIKDKLTKYLKNKDIIIEQGSYDLIWNYKILYSEFKVSLDIRSRYPNKYDDNTLIIKYFTSANLEGIRRRRTTASGNFYKSVYDNLMWIKESLDKIAEEQKIKIDRKTKYCTELELHYKGIHKTVSISIDKQSSDDLYNITINGSDNYINNTRYEIIYKNNKYFLNSKSTELYEELN